jgi:hypothetical protein
MLCMPTSPILPIGRDARLSQMRTAVHRIVDLTGIAGLTGRQAARLTYVRSKAERNVRPSRHNLGIFKLEAFSETKLDRGSAHFSGKGRLRRVEELHGIPVVEVCLDAS